MANKRIKDISTTATSPNADDVCVIDGATSGTRKIDARPLGGVFDENITTTGGNVTITGDTSDAYTAGTLKLTAGNLGTNSIQLGDVSDADIGKIEYANSDNSLRFTINGSERWRITSAGTLLAAASETPIEWNGNGIVSASSHLYIRSTSGGNLYFQTGGAQRWEINSSGNLIGNSGGQILYGDGDVLFPGSSANFSWDKSSDTLTLQAGAKVGIGGSPAHPLTLTANPGAANTPVAWLHNSGNVSEYDGTVISTVNDGSDVEVLHVRTNTTTYDGGTSLMLVQGDGKVGIGSAPGSYNSNANNLVVGTGSGNEGLSISSGVSSEGGIYFADGTTGNEQYRGYAVYQHASDQLVFGTAGSNRLIIDSSGNVAIGHSAFGAKLDIATATGTAGIFIRDASDSSITHSLANASGNGSIALYEDGGGGAKVNITSNGNSYLLGGNLGLGTSAPSAPLSVENSSNPKVTFSYGGANAEHRISWDSAKLYLSADDGDAAASSEIGFRVDGSTKATIDSSGNLAIGRATAGARIDLATATDTAGIFVRDSSDSSITHQIYNASGHGNLAIYADGGVNTVNINSAGDTFFNGGSIGIGTASPDNKLTLDSGDIQLQASKSTNVDVQSINWKNTNSSGYDIARISAATGGNIYEGSLKFLTKDSGGTMAERLRVDSLGALDVKSVGGASAAQFPSAASVNGITALPSATGTPFLVGRDTGSLRSAHFAGNLKFDSGYGIDFSGTSDGSGTMSSELLDDYEEGTWVPVYTPTGGSFAAITMNVVAARYVKIGHQVTVNCYIQTTNLDTTGASGLVTVTGLPYANAGSNNYTAANIGYAIDWTEAPAGGHVSHGASEIVLNKRFTSITGSLSSMSVSDLNTTSGSKNTIMLTATYNSF